MLASLDPIARRHCLLTREHRTHLRRLVASWGVLADLSFSDLFLYAPATKSLDGPGRLEDQTADLVVLAQARPATAPTLYADGLIGTLQGRADHALVVSAYDAGTILTEAVPHEKLGHIKKTAIPVTSDGQVIAVLMRESVQAADTRYRGQLEQAYLDVSDRLATMISRGSYPFSEDSVVSEEAPRVGDGALVLTQNRTISYSSPNAVSAFQRTGFTGDLVGRRLDELGLSVEVVDHSFDNELPNHDEVELGENGWILAHIIPLLSGDDSVDGALVLIRDVTDIRHRDRLLVSMDATIREIHHRVKNNLQTVSSLLRLQARRVDSAEAKEAIEESVRRIASIAQVHELLSSTNSDDVRLSEVVQPILKMVRAGLVSPETPISFRLTGQGPLLRSAQASSLAVLITELVQNAVEHGFPDGSTGGRVDVLLQHTDTELTVEVQDDGVGLPPGFDLATSAGLGLTIARTLATNELGGDLTLEPAAPGHGTAARITIRLEAKTSSDRN